MADQLAQDLLNKLESVPGLSTATGMLVGNGTIDPGMAQLPLPAAWVILSDDQPQDGANENVVEAVQPVLTNYVVMVYVPFTDQQDLIDTQIPLLRAARAAVHGTPAPSGHRWRYVSQRLVMIQQGKLGYEQRYSIKQVI